MRNYTNVKILGVLCALTVAASGSLNAQEPSPRGQLTGSFETNTIWYLPDSLIYNDVNPLPKDRIGSNNYLKLDYTLGKFSAGIQGEMYAPVLQGYSPDLRGAKITNKYAAWTDESFSVHVGDFYGQYGSGLIFRAYEDRALGINNSVEGVRAAYNFKDIFSVNAMMGRPRLYMDYADCWLRGVDGSFSLSSLLGWENGYLALEGSYLSKYDAKRELNYTVIGPNGEERPLLSPNMNAWSGRIVYEIGGFSARGEVVGKSSDKYLVSSENVALFGRGQLVELGYAGYGWGVSLTGRSIDHMNMTITEDSGVGIYGMLNYIPALTRQYTYSLANLEVYEVKPEGEKAAQMDVFYSAKKGTWLGGKTGLKLHANASVGYQPHDPSNGNYEYTFKNLNASIDAEKTWNKQFKSTIFLGMQRVHGRSDKNLYNRYLLVLDGLYKFDKKNSLRVELQYLCSPLKALPEGVLQRDPVDTGSWWAAMVEYSFAPTFSFYVSDMYNFSTEKVHYYNVGFSYTKFNTRIALSYARSRAGFVCSGGVCRNMPAYSGLNLSLTTSF